MQGIVDVIFEESQVATAKSVFDKINSEASKTFEVAIVRFFEPFVDRGEFASRWSFTLGIQFSATLAEIEEDLQTAIIRNRITWYPTSYRRAHEVLASVSKDNQE